MTDLTTLDADDLTSLAQDQLDAIDKALDVLAVIADTLVDRDGIAAVLYELHAAVVGWSSKGHPAKARLVLDAYKTALMAEAGERAFDTAQGRWEIKKTTKRTGWQWDALIPRLVAAGQTERRIINPDAGEVESEGHAVARALRESLSFSSAKVTGLRSRSIDPSDYCVEEDGGYDLMVPAPVAPRKTEAAA